MTPQLMRFYGGSVAEWSCMPWGEAMRWFAAMNRIRADEYLGLSMVAAAGAGGMESKVLKGTLKRWRAAAGYDEPAVKKVSSADEMKKILGGMGIAVEVS